MFDDEPTLDPSTGELVHRVRDRDDLLDVNWAGKRPARKVVDESTERAEILRVEDDSGSQLVIRPRTVDFDLVEGGLS